MSAPGTMTGDPISAAIVRAALASTAREVFARFVRTSLTPTIYDAHDFSVAVFDDAMNVVADASGLPEYVGSLSFTVQAIVAAFGRDHLRDGDVVICSQPFTTGAHPPDVAVVTPAFADGMLVGFVAVRGHMGDVGARNAYPADSRSVYEEGLVLPPIKLYREGVLNEDVTAIVAANSRMPRETVGNLRAAASATRSGAVRVGDIVRAHGLPSYRLGIAGLLDNAELTVRSVLAQIPDGEYVVRDVLDCTGTDALPIPLVCTVRITGSEIEVDVTGSAPEQDGALNVPYAQTVAACRLALKRLTTEDSVPANSGEYRALTVTAPLGTIFNAQPPAGSFMMHVAASMLSEMVVTAVMPALPDRIPAPTAGHTTAFLAEISTERVYAQVDDAAPIGYGALAGQDGTNALQHFAIAGIGIAAAEIWEAQAPVLKLSCELVTDSGGAGRWRGGLGTRVEWRFDVPAELTIQGERVGVLPDTGRAGGRSAGGRNDAQISVGTPRERSTGMATDVQTRAGDRVVLNGAGGGGYGDPFTRDPKAVVDDVLSGFVSLSRAESDYGVVLDPLHLTIDLPATRRLRQETADVPNP